MGRLFCRLSYVVVTCGPAVLQALGVSCGRLCCRLDERSLSRILPVLQALVGIAFSVGFLIGPTIGAYFSLQAKGQDGMFFVAPALFALLLAVINIVFTFFFMEETLPAKNRVSVSLYLITWWSFIPVYESTAYKNDE